MRLLATWRPDVLFSALLWATAISPERASPLAAGRAAASTEGRATMSPVKPIANLMLDVDLGNAGG